MKRAAVLISTASLVGLFATSPPASATLTESCKLTGSGVIQDAGVVHDFTIEAQVKKGITSGEVVVVTSNGDEFIGTITLLQCRRNGGGGPGSPAGDTNIGDVEGVGTWNGAAGYEFVATMHDHGEGASRAAPISLLADDFTIAAAEPGGPILYTAGGLLASGNVQLHPQK